MNVLGDGDKINGKTKHWKLNYIKNKYTSRLRDGH